MKKSKRMQILVDLAKSKETTVAKKLAAQQQQVIADQDKLKQLQEYAQQYESERNLLGLNPFLAANYQHFVERLGQAVNQQKQVIARSEQQAAFAKNQWVKARGKTKSMDWLQEKYVKSEVLVEQKQEQSQGDEFAMRRFTEAMRN